VQTVLIVDSDREGELGGSIARGLDAQADEQGRSVTSVTRSAYVDRTVGGTVISHACVDRQLRTPK
jgi:hypothetical protein